MSELMVFGVRAYLAVAALTDMRWGRIPNLLSALGALAAFSFDILILGAWDGALGLLRSAVLLVILYPLFLMGVIGAGDVKLLSVCAIITPVAGLGRFLFCSLVWGGLFSLLRMIRRRQLFYRLIKAVLYIGDMFRVRHVFRYRPDDTSDSYIPFGVCIFLGYLVATV